MKPDNPIKHFSVDLEKIQYIGKDLQRPECILAEPDGSLWAADARGGVCRIHPDGTQEIISQSYSSGISSGGVNRFFEGTLPNGLAFASNGDILISNFGTDCLERMKRTGETEILFDSIDGNDIGKVNFVLRDSKERLWITISTMKKSWLEALRPDLDDGYIARYDDRGLHIVADGLHFTNEIRFDANEEHIYVVETTGGRILRFKADSKGDLAKRETFGPSHMGIGAYPDGIAFDSYGNLWGTMVYSDKLFAITPDGEFILLLDEGDPIKVKALDDAFWEKRVTNEVLFSTGQGIAPWMASVTFGGKNLDVIYIGSLRGSRIPYFKAPASGLPMAHWKQL
ncbi:MAG: SMP-30/gluconolactonase/LRE family protein [Clostridiales bacterium]|nr:SMP-30/gluconolactonase/LRE family protein [Clostridiales bacterium]